MKLAHWTAPQLVFIDESGINTKLGERTHGYSTKGKVIRAKVSPGRAENFSLLPALSIDGYFACKLYRGSINAERFTEFIEQEVLPKCKPYPGPRSVIIMDNASIHRAEVLIHPFAMLIEGITSHYRGKKLQARIPSSLFSRLQPHRILFLRY